MTSLSPLVTSLVDAAVDAAAVVSPTLELLYYNAQYLRLAGLRRRDLRGKPRVGMCHNHFDLESCTDGCLSHKAIDAGRPLRVDEVMSFTRPLKVIAVSVPLFDAAGEVFAVLEQFRDVTAEGRLQENYRRLLEKERAQKEILAAEVQRQTSELERVNRSLLTALQEVSRVARTDGLTSLANRRSFDEQVRGFMAQARLHGTPLSLVLFDLDHFKRVNDELGHPQGDEVLKRFAATLASVVRPPEFVARVGGEEFAILLPGSHSKRAEEIAKRVQQAAASAHLETTASGGVASFPSDGNTTMELLRAADRALYAAKDAGRDKILVASRLREGRIKASTQQFYCGPAQKLVRVRKV